MILISFTQRSVHFDWKQLPIEHLAIRRPGHPLGLTTCLCKQITHRNNMTLTSDSIATTKRWLDEFVIGLNLCPFAQRERVSQRIHFVHSDATEEQALLDELQAQLSYLIAHSNIETTLLIHPEVLTDFDQYNQFLDLADQLLLNMQLDGVVQIASFHPDYQFAETLPSDAQNYSNRSPYPMLHLLREDSVARAIDQHGNVGQIPEDNQQRLEALGSSHLKEKRNQLFS